MELLFSLMLGWFQCATGMRNKAVKKTLASIGNKWLSCDQERLIQSIIPFLITVFNFAPSLLQFIAIINLSDNLISQL